MNGERGASTGRPAARVLRPTSATVAMIVAGVGAALMLGDALVRAGVIEMLLLAPWVLLAVWGVYVLLYASHIAFDAQGVTVQNYLRVIRLPWGRVQDISLRWQVVFDATDGSAVTAYGGPVVGRPGRAAGRTRGDTHRGGAGSTGPPTSLPASLREVSELRDAWQEAAAAPRGTEPVGRSWDVRALLALALILVAGVVSALSTAG